MLNLLLGVLRVGLALVMAAVLALVVAFGVFSVHDAQHVQRLRDRPGSHVVAVDVLYSDEHCAKSCSYEAHGQYDPPGPGDRQNVDVYPYYGDNMDGRTVNVLVSASDPDHGLAAGATATGSIVAAGICLVIAMLIVFWLPVRWLLHRLRRRAPAENLQSHE